MPLTITKRGKVYHVAGTVAGQRIRESTGCSKRSDAAAWAHRRERELIERHALGEDATLTFAQAALDYLNAGGEGRFLARTIEHLGPTFLARDVTNTVLNQAAADLMPTAAPATINRQIITPVRAVLTMAAEDGKIPWRKFRTRKGDNKRTRWLRPEEFEALLAASSDALAPILLAMVGTGARGGWRVADMAMRYRKAAPDDLAQQLVAWGWEFDRLGRSVRAPDNAPIALYQADGGTACSWPRRGDQADRPRFRAAS